MQKTFSNTLVILCAGMGKRLGPLSAGKPKCLLEINKKSILELAVDQFNGFNVNHFVLLVGHRAELVINKKVFLLKLNLVGTYC